jgi:hypothetical protein
MGRMDEAEESIGRCWLLWDRAYLGNMPAPLLGCDVSLCWRHLSCS